MNKIKYMIIIFIGIIIVSYLLWNPSIRSYEEYQYIQDYYHLNLGINDDWYYQYHGKYFNTDSINKNSIITIRNNVSHYIYDEHNNVLADLKIHVSKNQEKLKELYFKDIVNNQRESIYKENRNSYSLEVFKDYSGNKDHQYQAVYLFQLNKDDNYYYFECFNIRYEDENDVYSINEEDFNVYLYFINQTINGVE